jgi:hypothetical protein
MNHPHKIIMNCDTPPDPLAAFYSNIDFFLLFILILQLTHYKKSKIYLQMECVANPEPAVNTLKHHRQKAPIRTIIFMGVISFLSCFGFAAMLDSLNAAMETYRTFVNASLTQVCFE